MCTRRARTVWGQLAHTNAHTHSQHAYFLSPFAIKSQQKECFSCCSKQLTMGGKENDGKIIITIMLTIKAKEGTASTNDLMAPHWTKGRRELKVF